MKGCFSIIIRRHIYRFQISVSDVIVHSLWNPDLESSGNDIALIRLPNLVQTVAEDSLMRVAPICLSATPPRSNLEVIGWGRSNRPGEENKTFTKFGFYHRILQKLGVPNLPVGECERQYQMSLRPAYVCAGGTPGEIKCHTLIR